MIQVRDTCEESGAHRKLVTSILGSADLIKSASAEPESRASVQHYADDFNKMWPMDNERQLVESTVSVLMQKDAMSNKRFDRVFGALSRRAYTIGAFEDMVAAKDAFDKASNSTVKSASTGTSIAALTKLASAESIKAMRAEFPFPVRQEMAREILTMVDQHGVKLAAADLEALEKTAGAGVNSMHELARALVSRANMVSSQSPQLGRELFKAAADIELNKADSIEELTKLASYVAEVIDRTDKKFGFDRLYGQSLQCPEDTVFALTISKMASIVDSHTRVGDAIYANDDLLKTAASVLSPIDSELPAKVATAAGTIDPAKLASEAKRGGADILNRVLNGFGLRNSSSVPAAPVGKVASDGLEILRNDRAAWDRLARGFAGDGIFNEGDRMTFAMRHPQHILGDRSAN